MKVDNGSGQAMFLHVESWAGGRSRLKGRAVKLGKKGKGIQLTRKEKNEVPKKQKSRTAHTTRRELEREGVRILSTRVFDGEGGLEGLWVGDSYY